MLPFHKLKNLAQTDDVVDSLSALLEAGAYTRPLLSST